MKHILSNVALMGTLCFTATAKAEIIQFEVNGSFERVQQFDHSVVPDVQLGDLFKGRFSFDNEEPLSWIVQTGTRSLYNTGELTIKSGKNTYYANQDPQLQVFNNWQFTNSPVMFDDLFLSSFEYDNSGFYLLQLNMRDYTFSTLDSLALPSADQILGLNNASPSFFLRRFDNDQNEQWIADGSASLAQVSAPSTLLLSLFALSLFCWNRIKR